MTGANSKGIEVARSAAANIGTDFTGSGLAILGTDGTGAGIYLLGKATITGSLLANSVAIVQPTAEAIYVEQGASLSLTDSAVVDNEGVGALVNSAGTTFVATGVLVEGNGSARTPTTTGSQGISWRPARRPRSPASRPSEAGGRPGRARRR